MFVGTRVQVFDPGWFSTLLDGSVVAGTTIPQMETVYNHDVKIRYINMNMNGDPSASPCDRRCCLDGDLCASCYRTRQEIVTWRGMSREDRIRVNLEAIRRKEEHND